MQSFGGGSEALRNTDDATMLHMDDGWVESHFDVRRRGKGKDVHG